MNTKQDETIAPPMDPEFVALYALQEALDALPDEAARERVLRWAFSRYTPSMSPDLDAVVARIAATGRREVKWMADHVSNRYDRAHVMGYEDGVRDSIRAASVVPAVVSS